MRGIGQYLPIPHGVVVVCERYNPWQFPADYVAALGAITQPFVDQIRSVGNPYLVLPEGLCLLREAIEGINIEVTIFHDRTRSGKRHTFLSVAATPVAFNEMNFTAGTAHYAVLLPSFREMPLVSR